MIRCRAAWLLPIGRRPLRDSWIAIDRGRIVSCGLDGGPPGAVVAPEIDLGNVAILPGLVNAHTHLELSYLRDRIPPGASFVSWIRALMATRRAYPDPDTPEIRAGVVGGIDEAVRCGTAAVGDISNTLVTFHLLGRSPLAALVFYEVIGFNPGDAKRLVDGARETLKSINWNASGQVRATLAAHAPYSVAPAVFRAMGEAIAADELPACSVHVAESAEEIEFIRTGGGPWRELLENLGVWNPSWLAPAVSPVEYLEDNTFLGPRVLAVHGVQMTDADLTRLARRGATLVTCPRSNVYTRAGKPPIERFYASGVRVAIGTDSLASVPDLNVFAELAALRELAPSIPASVLLESATRQGAIALGFDGDYGTIAPGKRARLIAVTLPAAVDDVEEYLVSGIEAEQIRWLDDILAESQIAD